MSLQIHHLTLRTPTQVLVQDLHLNLKMGDRLVVYGENGTGKSTLLRELVLAAQKKEPRIQWSLDLDQIHYMPQNNPFQSKTPDSVMDYLVKTLSVYQEVVSLESIKRVLLRLRLSDKWMAHLSGGERQKLKLAQGLLLKSQAFLMDEPLSGVDNGSKFEIFRALNEIRQQTLQILVVHDLLDIRKLQCPVLVFENQKALLLSSQAWFQKVDSQFHSEMCEHHELEESPWV